MALIPWRGKARSDGGSLAPLAEFRTEMDRLFDSFVRDPLGGMSRLNGGSWPSVDIAENDKEVTVKAEIPGVRPEDFDVRVSGNVLTISGEKKEEKQEVREGFFHRETHYGSFRRDLTLPATVNAEQVSAEYANGVLTVRLQKSPEAVARHIQVKSS